MPLAEMRLRRLGCDDVDNHRGGGVCKMGMAIVGDECGVICTVACASITLIVGSES